MPHAFIAEVFVEWAWHFWIGHNIIWFSIGGGILLIGIIAFLTYFYCSPANKGSINGGSKQPLLVDAL